MTKCNVNTGRLGTKTPPEIQHSGVLNSQLLRMMSEV
jgi:hypothetical protein